MSFRLWIEYVGMCISEDRNSFGLFFCFLGTDCVGVFGQAYIFHFWDPFSLLVCVCD